MSRPKGSKNKTTVLKEMGIVPDIEQKGLAPSFGRIDSLLIAPKVIANNPVELLKLNKNIVGVCNQRNATAIASTPLRLFAIKNNKSQKFLYPTKELNHVEVDKIKRESKSFIVKQASNIVEVVEHPVFNVLNNVNDSDLNYYDGMELTSSYLGMIGNCFWQIVKKGKTPIGINVLPAEYTTVKLDNEMNVTGYRTFNGIYEMNYEPSQIIHFKNVAPGLFWRVWNNALKTGIYGMGDCEYVLDEIYLYNSILDYLRALTENNSIPASIIKYKAGRLDKNTMQDVQSQWDKVLRTWKRAGKTKVMDQDFDFIPVSLPPKDLDFENGRKWLLMVIANAFGVPVDLLTTDNSNRATANTAISNYFRFTIKPKLKRLEEKLNSHLMPLFDSDLFLEFDEVVPNDEALAIKQENQDLLNGVITINEVRKSRGLSDVEWGNEPYAPKKETIRESLDIVTGNTNTQNEERDNNSESEG